VVSTALHEFQGLSVLEASQAGCLPLVPDRLCYPEMYPADCRYDPDVPDSLETRLTTWLTGQRPPLPDVSPWCAARLDPVWRKELAAL
jgi:hypothetical protein